MSAFSPLSSLRPEGHAPHVLHAHGRDFRETNCYVDLFIELVHALGLDPHACLAFTLATDFEGDHWTFGKPPLPDLEFLYGIRVDEMSIWRSVLDHAEHQVGRGRVVLAEVDAYHLPDTAGTDYRHQHVKTTIGIVHLDRAARRMRYFHNATFAELSGDDFDGVFHPEGRDRSGYLPPYCEIAKLERVQRLDLAKLRDRSRELARIHHARRPAQNPIRAYAARIPEHVELILAGGLPTYHAYTFASLRQLGASLELGASFLRWLDPDAATTADAFSFVAASTKTLVLKLARIASARRAQAVSGSFDEMATAWERGMEALGRVLAR